MIAVHFNIVNVFDFCVLVLDEVEQRPRLASAVVGVPSKVMVMTHDLNLLGVDDVADHGDDGRW